MAAHSNLFAWQCYLGEAAGSETVSAYAAPARADNLAGLPPTLIVTATLDLFLEEDLDYARRLTRAGVPIELIVYPGAYHGFHVGSSPAFEARYRRDVTSAIEAGLAKRA